MSHIFETTNMNKEEFMNVVAKVSEKTGVSVEDLLTTKKLDRKTTTPRHICMYILRESGMAYHNIAALYGRPKHTGVMHGCKVIEGFVSVDPKFKEYYEEIKDFVGI